MPAAAWGAMLGLAETCRYRQMQQQLTMQHHNQVCLLLPKRYSLRCFAAPMLLASGAKHSPYQASAWRESFYLSRAKPSHRKGCFESQRRMLKDRSFG